VGYFTSAWKSVEFFVSTFTKCLHESPVHSEDIFFWPPEEGSAMSRAEQSRIRRYLSRFQICCDVSKYWRPSEEVEVAREGADSRVNRMIEHLEPCSVLAVEETVVRV